MRRRPMHPAFTLIELILVLMLMALLVAAVTPNLVGFGRGQRTEFAADDVLAAAHWARSEAITAATPHRLELADNVLTVTRLEGLDYVTVSGGFGVGRPFDGVRVQVERQDGAGLAAIDFYPNGRISPAVVTLTNGDGRIVTLSAPGAADPLRRVEGGQP